MIRFPQTLVVLLALVATPALPLFGQKGAVAPQASYAGEWTTTFGRMVLKQEGTEVSGKYMMGETVGLISGTLDGRRFNFRYTEPAEQGGGWFELTESGKQFRGRWRVDGSQEWAAWVGSREADAKNSGPTFAGLWQTTYGRMRIQLDGDLATGAYSYDGIAKIKGRVSGNRLNFTYVEPSGVEGKATFVLAEDGTSFSGTWSQTKPASTGEARWQGTRVTPVPGQIWLVILETHWETDLASSEYSYGSMLRSFFTRAPHVQVRHRRVHDSRDLGLFMREVSFMAEPVVLYVSSHGTRRGVIAGPETVGASAITDALQYADNVRLLHFGACSIMAGPVPQQIHDGIDPAHSFPISGFDRVVDWAASAIVDFTYLDLVLVRKMPPEQALKQVRQMLTFAGDRTSGRSALPATGLTILPAGRTTTASTEDNASESDTTLPASEPAAETPATGQKASGSISRPEASRESSRR